ncbi:restriction endonuclease subunit S [Listeria monocytogenes]|nr:restriction endonuclease subunit S [Listeria monocytogenes]EAF3425467.1 restriction endonuclease subunit S [Listeria monocytogenes]EAF4175970.1 restriction endonuclease subunit S [Listeria monocytogenes]EAF4179508.1 restriction endonuclease subunit S [Listeria monocytogenes]EAF4188381.1 restriction endonuclease subunit S [Listeria monocytogenes]
MSHIKKYAPRRRFEKFSNADDWEQRKLEDILDVRSGRDYKHLDSGDIPVYGTGGYMLSVGEALSYEEDAIGIGRKGTIDKPYILKAPFWTVDTLFYTVPKRDSDLNFIHSIFQKINWKSKDESTGVPSLSKTTINAVSVFTPSCSEQKEIGTFFNKLDDTIALHQRKLEKIKALKTAYLSEMFPAEGETKPKRRFAGFTDDWEQRKLGEESDVRDGTHDSPKYVNTGHPLVTSKNLKDFGLDFSDVSFISDEDFESINKRSKVDVGDILFGMIGTIGTPVQLIRKDFAIKNVALIKEKKNILNSFLIHLLKSAVFDRYIENENTGGTQKFLSLSKIRDFYFLSPKLEEQYQISLFFKQLDSTIALHQRKLQKLQNIKKAYLNEMFI